MTGTALEVWEGCAPYGENPDLFTYCLGTGGDRLGDAAAVEQLCPHAAAWENACRLLFVLRFCGQPAGPGRDALLTACAGDEDCALEVLDCRHDPDVVAQLGLCAAHLDRLGGDCEAHAFDRWLMSSPGPEERSRLAGSSAAAARPRAAGLTLARAITCAGEGSCEGPPELRAACQEQRSALSTGEPDCSFEAPYGALSPAP